jgi:hypothetical protein
MARSLVPMQRRPVVLQRLLMLGPGPGLEGPGLGLGLGLGLVGVGLGLGLSFVPQPATLVQPLLWVPRPRPLLLLLRCSQLLLGT